MSKFESSKLRFMRSVIIIIPFLFLGSCGWGECEKQDDIAAQPMSIEVERLEEVLYTAKDEQAVSQIITEHPTFAQLFLHADQYPADSILAARIFNLMQQPFDCCCETR